MEGPMLQALPTVSVGEFRAKYHLEGYIGNGSFAQVWRCTRRSTGEACAVKCFAKEEGSPGTAKNSGNTSPTWSVRRTLAEIAIMQQLQHDAIIRLEEAINGQTTLYMVMELAEGGSVRSVLNRPFRYSEALAAELIRTVLGAVEYMHDLRVAHCDLKPENLLLTHPLPSTSDDLLLAPHLLTAVKIADFGFAQVVGEVDNLRTCCGTPFYVAPEVLLCGYFKKGPPYGRAVDMWSIGIMVYMLLTGTTPFEGERQVDLFTAIVKGGWCFPPTAQLSAAARHFICSLLVPVDQRMTASQALRHNWLVRHPGALEVPSSPDLRDCPSPTTYSPTFLSNFQCSPRAGPLHEPSHTNRRTRQPYGPRQAFPSAPTEKVLEIPQPPSPQVVKRKKKKLILRKEDFDTEVDKITKVLDFHHSVTYVDLSHDVWSPRSAAKALSVIQVTGNICLVDTPTTPKVHRSALRTVDDLLALNATSNAESVVVDDTTCTRSH